MNSTLQQSGFGNLLMGSLCLPLVLNDGDANLRRHSRAQSGDYFATLATELENLSEQTEDMMVQMKLEELIKELEYLQQKFAIVPRR